MILRQIINRLMSRVQMKAVIPPGTSTEQAVEIVATSDWAQNIARAQASIALFGTPEPPAQMSPEERAIYERLVKNYARYVAMGFLGLR